MSTGTAIVLLATAFIGVAGFAYVSQHGGVSALFGPSVQAAPKNGTSIGLGFNYSKFGS